MTLWCLRFPQKNERKSFFGGNQTIFVRFLEEIEDTKNHFEINWPLRNSSAHLWSPFLIIGYCVYNNNLTTYLLLTHYFNFNYRFVVATRKITGGEIIFREEPILVGPRLDPDVLPMCSGCFGKLKKINYKWVEILMFLRCKAKFALQTNI